MLNNNLFFNFDNSYLDLPNQFYSKVLPTPITNPKIVCCNKSLAEQLNLISLVSLNQYEDYLSGNKIPEGAEPIAQAYAGHQFGNFTMLGDGRAILLGEHITQDNQRYDIQLKGAGRTQYSRGGDGRATLRSMLREYLISEAMFYLNIPTSRSLSVVSCDDKVYRNEIHAGGVLTRVLKSHIRVGTFEYAKNYTSLEEQKIFMNYVLKRHYPKLLDTINPALEFFKTVCNKQIDLILNWMRVGFIHGVMNTDNTSIAVETFDYGPCAFMNAYDPNTVFSSIDRQGRYSYQNQIRIIYWNMSVLADSILPLISEDIEESIKLVQDVLTDFSNTYEEKWYSMMLSKIGIRNGTIEDRILIDELLEWMLHNKVDFTNFFASLKWEHIDFFKDDVIKTWYSKWQNRVSSNKEEVNKLMQESNPIFIPRNALVEQALDLAISGDFNKYNSLLEILKTPYIYQKVNSMYFDFSIDYDMQYKTYCGT